jgi:hypothetical protein
MIAYLMPTGEGELGRSCLQGVRSKLNICQWACGYNTTKNSTRGNKLELSCSQSLTRIVNAMFARSHAISRPVGAPRGSKRPGWKTFKVNIARTIGMPSRVSKVACKL